jgi:hypothetical protein
MRTLGILAVAAACAASAGCSEFLHLAMLNLVETPIQSFDECRMAWRNRRRADEAWALIRGAGEHEYSSDYAAGFKAGYADYLDNGGNGDPPAVPPFRYRSVKYQSPEGVEAINGWYAGWKHGALMAKASGQREVEVIPLSAPPINAVGRDYGPPIELPPLPPPVGEPLPPPHPLPPPNK